MIIIKYFERFWTYRIISILMCVFLIFSNVFASQNFDNNRNSQTIIIKKETNQLAPAEYFAKDTITTPNYDNEGTLKPGYSESYFNTPFQDSAYKRAMMLHIPSAVRFSHEFKMFSEKRAFERELEKGLPWQIALENLRIKPEFLAPLPQDIVHRQEMINNALFVPFLNNRITSGLSLDAREVAVFFGLAEDVSPIMKFDLNYAEEVEIVIYSIQASVIATVFKGIRQPGSHKFVWNGRDDKGRPVESGDYIGEIRIGNSRFVRKRITIY